MFMQEKITLSELVTSEVDEDLMQYLCSFEGLRKLEIKFSYAWDRLSNAFFDLALPKHSHSLEVLGVGVRLDLLAQKKGLIDHFVRHLIDETLILL